MQSILPEIYLLLSLHVNLDSVAEALQVLDSRDIQGCIARVVHDCIDEGVRERNNLVLDQGFPRHLPDLDVELLLQVCVLLLEVVNGLLQGLSQRLLALSASLGMLPVAIAERYGFKKVHA